MSLARTAVIFLALLADGPATAPIRVSAVIGRVYEGNVAYLLEDESTTLRLVQVDVTGQIRSSVAFPKPSAPVDSAGLARSTDGLFWVLADRGTALVGFDPAAGKIADVRPLPTNFVGIWSVQGMVMLAALRLEGGQKFLFQMTAEGIREFGALRMRESHGIFDAPILSLFSCGVSRIDVTPCWWLAGQSRLFLIRSSGESKVIAVPSRVPNRNSLHESSDPLKRFDYPIGDVMIVDTHRTWVLANQEGSESAGSENSNRGLHLLLVVDSKLTRSIRLPQKASYILGGDEKKAILLFSDGTIGAIGSR